MPEHVTERQRDAAGRFASMLRERVKEAVFASPVAVFVGGLPRAQVRFGPVDLEYGYGPVWYSEVWSRDLPVDLGMSGGPMVDACGRVVGVVHLFQPGGITGGVQSAGRRRASGRDPRRGGVSGRVRSAGALLPSSPQSWAAGATGARGGPRRS